MALSTVGRFCGSNPRGPSPRMLAASTPLFWTAVSDGEKLAMFVVIWATWKLAARTRTSSSGRNTTPAVPACAGSFLALPLLVGNARRVPHSRCRIDAASQRRDRPPQQSARGSALGGCNHCLIYIQFSWEMRPKRLPATNFPRLFDIKWELTTS